jgi:hypothetical protein
MSRGSWAGQCPTREGGPLDSVALLPRGRGRFSEGSECRRTPAFLRQPKLSAGPAADGSRGGLQWFICQELRGASCLARTAVRGCKGATLDANARLHFQTR